MYLSGGDVKLLETGHWSQHKQDTVQDQKKLNHSETTESVIAGVGNTFSPAMSFFKI